MTRPDDIPESVWAKAVDAVWSVNAASTAAQCAAIMARFYLPAQAEATEAAAKIAESVKHPRGDKFHTADWLAGTCAAADAIRASLPPAHRSE